MPLARFPITAVSLMRFTFPFVEPKVKVPNMVVLLTVKLPVNVEVEPTLKPLAETVSVVGDNETVVPEIVVAVLLMVVAVPVRLRFVAEIEVVVPEIVVESPPKTSRAFVALLETVMTA